MIINNKMARTLISFSDLPVGTWYLDEDNILCIKASNESFDNCICFNNEYCVADECLGGKVAPVEVEINILSYIKV